MARSHSGSPPWYTIFFVLLAVVIAGIYFFDPPLFNNMVANITHFFDSSR